METCPPIHLTITGLNDNYIKTNAACYLSPQLVEIILHELEILFDNDPLKFLACCTGERGHFVAWNNMLFRVQGHREGDAGICGHLVCPVNGGNFGFCLAPFSREGEKQGRMYQFTYYSRWEESCIREDNETTFPPYLILEEPTLNGIEASIITNFIKQVNSEHSIRPVIVLKQLELLTSVRMVKAFFTSLSSILVASGLNNGPHTTVRLIFAFGSAARKSVGEVIGLSLQNEWILGGVRCLENRLAFLKALNSAPNLSANERIKFPAAPTSDLLDRATRLRKVMELKQKYNGDGEDDKGFDVNRICALTAGWNSELLEKWFSIAVVSPELGRKLLQRRPLHTSVVEDDETDNNNNKENQELSNVSSDVLIHLPVDKLPDWSTVRPGAHKDRLERWITFCLRRISCSDSKSDNASPLLSWGLQNAISKGVLLIGPNGSGKTHILCSICKEFSRLTQGQVSIFWVSVTSLLQPYLGQSESMLRSVFAKARGVSSASECGTAPISLLILDNLQVLGMKRSGHDNPNAKLQERLLTTLLNELDGLENPSSSAQSSSSSKKPLLIVVASTLGKVESLDEAIIRPGRFDLHIPIR